MEKIFLFLVGGRGPISWMGLYSRSINSTHLNPALGVLMRDVHRGTRKARRRWRFAVRTDRCRHHCCRWRHGNCKRKPTGAAWRHSSRTTNRRRRCSSSRSRRGGTVVVADCVVVVVVVVVVRRRPDDAWVQVLSSQCSLRAPPSEHWQHCLLTLTDQRITQLLPNVIFHVNLGSSFWFLAVLATVVGHRRGRYSTCPARLNRR